MNEQAKMLIMPSNLLNAKIFSRCFICAKHFFPSPSEKALKIFASFPQPIGWKPLTESLNRIVHFKTLNKFNASLGLDLC